MITFSWHTKGKVKSVFKGVDKIGTIRKCEGGWKYAPLFSKKAREDAKVFKKLSDCEGSLK